MITNCNPLQRSQIERKAYYHNTDAIGIMYYGAYLTILEEGRTDFFETNGINVKKLHERGYYFVIKELKINYTSPGRFGESIICESSIEKTTAARILFSQKIYTKESGQLLVDAGVVLIIFNKKLKPVRLPKHLYTLMDYVEKG